MITATKYRISITTEDEVLGMASGNPDVHREYIASKSADAAKTEEELAALPAADLETRARTVFPKDKDGTPFLWDYQLRGWIKDGIDMLLGIKGTCCASRFTAWTYRKQIDGCVFVQDRVNRFKLPAGGKIGECVRPLRAMTMQGPRVSLATSESIPAGSEIVFVIEVLEPIQKAKRVKAGEEEKERTPVASLLDCIKEVCEYGKYRGLGQWRNSGKGRFRYTLEAV